MTIEDVKVINVDGTPYVVDECSDSVKRLVTYYNNWRRDEYAANEKALMVSAALRELSREIIVAIRKEKEEAEKAAANDAANDVADAGPDTPVSPPADKQEINPDEIDPAVN